MAIVTMNGIEEEVLQFVAERARHPASRLNPQTTLFGDLGIDGDDADEFLLAYVKRFGVDMSSYRADRHFGPEGLIPPNPFRWLATVWRGLDDVRATPEARVGLRPITIQDLVASAKAAKWTFAYEK